MEPILNRTYAPFRQFQGVGLLMLPSTPLYRRAMRNIVIGSIVLNSSSLVGVGLPITRACYKDLKSTRPPHPMTMPTGLISVLLKIEVSSRNSQSTIFSSS